jgi:hypothetical protein
MDNLKKMENHIEIEIFICLFDNDFATKDHVFHFVDKMVFRNDMYDDISQEDKIAIVTVVFDKLEEKGYIFKSNNNTMFYSISYDGLRYAFYEKDYIDIVNFYSRILVIWNQLNDNRTQIEKLLNMANNLDLTQKEMLNKIENDKQTVNEIITKANEIDKNQKVVLEETNNLKEKMVEMLGLFVAIFSLISVNASFFSNIKNMNIHSLISLMLCLNGSVLLSIIVLLFGINLIIFKSEKRILKGWWLIFLPIILITLGLIVGK